MEIYLVGGAIRDKLLNLPVHERDWVVVGSTPKEMLELNYKPVGKDFPVFLHPITHEEYALARTERKIAKGYKGFSFYTSPEVTLEEDLARRDLTINAIAEDPSGKLIDPYHGLDDLNNKVFRHVSSAFQEDPVRILRAARFAAKLPDFSFHPETLELMRNMVKAGEVSALVSERVWQECARALKEKKPQRFFETLRDVGALELLFPELHRFAILEKINPDDSDPLINWALILHQCEPDSIQQLAARLRCPREYTEFALLLARHLNELEELKFQEAETFLNLILKTDALRRPERFQQFIQACYLINPSLKSYDEKINKALLLIKNLDVRELQAEGLVGEAFANALYLKRLTVLREFLIS